MSTYPNSFPYAFKSFPLTHHKPPKAGLAVMKWTKDSCSRAEVLDIIAGLLATHFVDQRPVICLWHLW